MSDPGTKDDLNALEIRMLEPIEKVEKTLLKELRKWAISFESRFCGNEILLGGFNERMISLEERDTNLKARR